MDARKLALAAADVPATPFRIPGATGGEFRIQLLNEDAAAGVVTSIVHIPAGGRIPAHRHEAGAEMHYVLEGDLIEAGQPLSVGAFLTHAAGVVHGPHESRGGAKVLTVQSWQSKDGDFDFIPAEATEGTPTGEMPQDVPVSGGASVEASDGAPTGEMRPVDQNAQAEARRDETAPEARGYS